MMQEDITNRILDAQEHPEHYTDEQLEEILAEADNLALLKRAMEMEDTNCENIDVEAEWAAFEAKHPEEKTIGKPISNHIRMKVAASTIGIIFIAGAAFAAAVGLGIISNPFSTKIEPKQEMIALVKTDTIAEKNDTIVSMPVKQEAKTQIFDNVKLEKIIAEISRYYHVEATFANEEAKHIRLYFEWDQAKSLDENIDILNSFQKITITRDNNKLTID